MTLLTRASQLFPDFPTGLSNFFNEDRDWGNKWMARVPAANITENDQGFNLELAAPGLQKDDFDITIDNQQLTVSSSQQEEKESKEDDYTRKEFSYNSFSRSFMLPETVEADKIKASYQEGVLKVQLPKKEAAKKTPKKLIKVG